MAALTDHAALFVADDIRNLDANGGAMFPYMAQLRAEGLSALWSLAVRPLAA
ncbi:MAG: hypothetical protein Q4G22_02095 [Paracoccus sp. (in: a-proteobacteria)]|uniref:hypothetical protein n=1 Tax=Paracoccus sp. TaxID=267 RepID=UPI0026DF1789|nr:hypothetical protein [Paracoccus sp. (in: a-proteobacteria)]MDO5630608.1 hypothetical protein [Paracoccus sp. (in: a-proteobacteria)]